VAVSPLRASLQDDYGRADAAPAIHGGALHAGISERLLKHDPASRAFLERIPSKMAATTCLGVEFRAGMEFLHLRAFERGRFATVREYLRGL